MLIITIAILSAFGVILAFCLGVLSIIAYYATDQEECIKDINDVAEVLLAWINNRPAK